VDRATRRLAAEKEKEKKDTEKAQARERMRAQEALEKRRWRQARDGLPLEPSPETPVTPGFKEQSRVHLIHTPRRQHI
jgi:hypothetical protein